VNGPGYEGVIVSPSASWFALGEAVLRRERMPGVTVTPWNPSAADIAAAETILTDFAARLARDPTLAGERLGSDHRVVVPRASELPTLLPTLKRHYFGLSHGDKRRIVIQMFPESVGRWQSGPVVMKDGGCANSWWEVDLAERRLRRWVCGGWA
jgi:hypothetical protein